MNWSSIRGIVDRVHSHACGRELYSDIRIILLINNIWNEDVQHYWENLSEKCTKLKASSTPSSHRFVSLSSLNTEFIDVVYIEHFFLDSRTIFHITDVSSRFSDGIVVASTYLDA